MATRWMQSKRDTIKRQTIKQAEIRNHRLGINKRHAGDADGDLIPQRALSDDWTLTEVRAKNIETPAHVPVKRCHVGEHTLKGAGRIMPQGSYGLTCRKAKGAAVKLWSGTDGRPNNAIAAPGGGRGMVMRNWSMTGGIAWAIVRKAGE